MTTRRLSPAARPGAAVALTVPRLLAARATAEPAHVAVRQGSDVLDLAGWQARTQAIAAGLRASGVGPGDRVGLLYGPRDWIAYVSSYTGVLAAGAVAIPVSTRTAPAEVAYMLEHSGATALLHGPDAERFDTPVRLRWGPQAVAELPVAAAPEDGPRPGDPAQILYTSGTTGRPKGVVAAHANLTHGARLDPPLRTLAHSRQFLHAFPIGTNAGQTMLFNALTSHAGMLVTARFGPDHFARLIEQQAVGSVFVVPAMAIELLRSGALERHDTSGVVLFGSTAAALPPTVASGLAASLPGATIVNYYTSTEAAPTQTSMIFSQDRPAAIGLAVAGGALRVCDEAGRPCPAGVTGEVWMRSAGAPRSYLDDPAATSKVFHGGWTRMGDIGYLDADGYLFLVDRESDVIKSGADKVSTIAVEAALHEHPEIVEASVFGLPDPVLGLAPAAALVTTRELRLAEVRRFLAPRLAGHEQPSRIVHVDELPRNAGGKVVKSRLRALFDPAPDTRAAGEERRNHG